MKNLIYRMKYKYADKLPLKKPVDVTLELSSFCNQKCKYCYHASSNKPFVQGFMHFETAKRIIDSAAQEGVHSIKFNWRGESTLNKDYARILKYASSKASGMTFIDRIVNTNMLLPKDRCNEIFEALNTMTKVKVSFDTFEPEIFGKQRGSDKDWFDVFENISAFHKTKKDNVELVIQAVKTKLNADENIEVLIKNMWHRASVSVRDMVDGRVENDNDLSVKEREVEKRKPCLQAFCRLIFDWKGRAYPCCPDIKSKLYLGDINNQTVAEIFNSPQAKQLRKNLKKGRAFSVDPCKTCSSFESYGDYKHGWKS